MKPLQAGRNVSEDLRPRLTVVLPLLAVCFLTIGFLLHDLVRPAAQKPGTHTIADYPPETASSRTRPTPPPGRVSRRFVPPRSPSTAESAEEVPVSSEANESVEVIPIPPPIVTAAPRTVHVQSTSPLVVQAKSGSTIRGFITLRGTPPPEREIPHDPICDVRRKEKLMTRLYQENPGTGGLADVIVYIKEGIENRTFEPARRPVDFRVIGCEFVPNC